MSAPAASSAKASPAPLTPAELQRDTAWRADPEMAFEEGVELAFARWEALHIAMNNMAGDAQAKLDDFINTCVDWFLDEKEAIHWDDVEGWLAEVLAEEFHIDAQDGSPEHIARLLCTLYHDIYKKADFTGLHRMLRTASDTQKKLLEARRIGQSESDRHNEAMEKEAEEENDIDEEDGEDDEEDTTDVTSGVAGLSVGSSSSSSAAAAAIPEEVEQKSAEQLQDEADGWETVPKKGKGKGKK
jgi:hypothetical protein